MSATDILGACTYWRMPKLIDALCRPHLRRPPHFCRPLLPSPSPRGQLRGLDAAHDHPVHEVTFVGCVPLRAVHKVNLCERCWLRRQPVTRSLPSYCPVHEVIFMGWVALLVDWSSTRFTLWMMPRCTDSSHATGTTIVSTSTLRSVHHKRPPLF
jgi:hypothetical protein